MSNRNTRKVKSWVKEASEERLSELKSKFPVNFKKATKVKKGSTNG